MMNISNMQYKTLLLQQFATICYLQSFICSAAGMEQEEKELRKKASDALTESKNALEIMGIFEEEEEN